MSRKRQPPTPASASGETAASDSINAIGIVRVSTTKQSDGMSPDVQQRGIEDYARRRGLRVSGLRDRPPNSGVFSRSWFRTCASMAKLFDMI